MPQGFLLGGDSKELPADHTGYAEICSFRYPGPKPNRALQVRTFKPLELDTHKKREASATPSKKELNDGIYLSQSVNITGCSGLKHLYFL